VVAPEEKIGAVSARKEPGRSLKLRDWQKRKMNPPLLKNKKKGQCGRKGSAGGGGGGFGGGIEKEGKMKKKTNATAQRKTRK